MTKGERISVLIMLIGATLMVIGGISLGSGRLAYLEILVGLFVLLFGLLGSMLSVPICKKPSVEVK